MGPAGRLSHGRAELRGGALATGEEDGIGTAAAEAEVEPGPDFVGWAKRSVPTTSSAIEESWWARRKGAFAHPTKLGGFSRSVGERLFRIGLDALDHRAQAVGTLRRQMIAEAEL